MGSAVSHERTFSAHTRKARKDALVRRYQTLLQCTRSIRSFNTLLHSAAFNNRSRRRSSGEYLKPDRNIENRSDHFSASIIDRLSVFFHSAILVPTILVSTTSVLTVCVFKISLNFKTLSKWLLFLEENLKRTRYGVLRPDAWTKQTGQLLESSNKSLGQEDLARKKVEKEY